MGLRTGSTATIVIKGDNLEDVNTVWFGDQIATDVKLVSDHEINAVPPPGTGDAPITMGQIPYSVQGARAQRGQSRPCFFTRRGAADKCKLRGGGDPRRQGAASGN